jgi:hypothetical protein
MSATQEIEQCPVGANREFFNMQHFEQNDSELGSKLSLDNKGS